MFLLLYCAEIPIIVATREREREEALEKLNNTNGQNNLTKLIVLLKNENV